MCLSFLWMRLGLGRRAADRGKPRGRTVGGPDTADIYTAQTSSLPNGPAAESRAAQRAAPSMQQVDVKALRDQLMLEASTSIVTVFAVQDGAILFQNRLSRAYYGDCTSVADAVKSFAAAVAAVAGAPPDSLSVEGNFDNPKAAGAAVAAQEYGHMTDTGPDADLAGSALGRLFTLEPAKLMRLLEAMETTAAAAQGGGGGAAGRVWKGVVRVPPRLAPPEAEEAATDENAAAVAKTAAAAVAAMTSEAAPASEAAGRSSEWPAASSTTGGGTYHKALARVLSAAEYQGSERRGEVGVAVRKLKPPQYQQLQQPLRQHPADPAPLPSNRHPPMSSTQEALADSGRLYGEGMYNNALAADASVRGSAAGGGGAAAAPQVLCRPRSGVLVSSTALSSSALGGTNIQCRTHGGALSWRTLKAWIRRVSGTGPPAAAAASAARAAAGHAATAASRSVPELTLPSSLSSSPPLAWTAWTGSGTAPDISATPRPVEQGSSYSADPSATASALFLYGTSAAAAGGGGGSTADSAQLLEEALLAGSGPLATSVLTVALSEDPSLARSLSIQQLLLPRGMNPRSSVGGCTVPRSVGSAVLLGRVASATRAAATSTPRAAASAAAPMAHDPSGRFGASPASLPLTLLRPRSACADLLPPSLPLPPPYRQPLSPPLPQQLNSSRLPLPPLPRQQQPQEQQPSFDIIDMTTGSDQRSFAGPLPRRPASGALAVLYEESQPSRQHQHLRTCAPEAACGGGDASAAAAAVASTPPAGLWRSPEGLGSEAASSGPGCTGLGSGAALASGTLAKIARANLLSMAERLAPPAFPDDPMPTSLQTQQPHARPLQRLSRLGSGGGRVALQVRGVKRSVGVSSCGGDALSAECSFMDDLGGGGGGAPDDVSQPWALSVGVSCCDSTAPLRAMPMTYCCHSTSTERIMAAAAAAAAAASNRGDVGAVSSCDAAPLASAPLMVATPASAAVSLYSVAGFECSLSSQALSCLRDDALGDAGRDDGDGSVTPRPPAPAAPTGSDTLVPPQWPATVVQENITTVRQGSFEVRHQHGFSAPRAEVEAEVLLSLFSMPPKKGASPGLFTSSAALMTTAAAMTATPSAAPLAAAEMAPQSNGASAAAGPGDDSSRLPLAESSGDADWGVLATFRQSTVRCGARSQGQVSCSGSDPAGRDSPNAVSFGAILNAAVAAADAPSGGDGGTAAPAAAAAAAAAAATAGAAAAEGTEIATSAAAAVMASAEGATQSQSLKQRQPRFLPGSLLTDALKPAAAVAAAAATFPPPPSWEPSRPARVEHGAVPMTAASERTEDLPPPPLPPPPPQCCYHRIVATPAVDPLTGRPVIVMVQDDVTVKVLLERQLGLVMETEHRLLEQLYPRHILRHLADQLVVAAQRQNHQQHHHQQISQLQQQLQRLAVPTLQQTASCRSQTSLAGHAAAVASRGDGGTAGSQRGSLERLAAPAAAFGGGSSAGRPGAFPRRSSSTGTASLPLRRLSPLVRDSSVTMATQHPQVTLLFADIKGFTPMCKEVEPRAVMMMLNDLFSRFDALLDKFGVRKVETIGDAYFVAGGLTFPEAADAGAGEGGGGAKGAAAVAAAPEPRHVPNVIGFAKAMLAAARLVPTPTSGESVQLRVGVHTGPVVSGLLGSRMPRFCLFGTAVATAARMESTGEASAVHISEATYDLLPRRHRPGWQAAPGVEVKGYGRMRTYIWNQKTAAAAMAAAAVTAKGPGQYNPS